MLFKYTCALFWVALQVTGHDSAAASQCYGTVGNGSLDNGVKLPTKGDNFSAYSTLGSTLGRTYVHASVADIVLSTYAALAKERPSSSYVYGETGWKSGGRIRPHRTHQNGTSVDFFVPVLNAQGQSVALPTNIMSRFGYDIEFDTDGKYAEYRIDFEAMAEHLYQLDLAAKSRGLGISQLIFESAYLPSLFASKRGTYLKQHLKLMKGKPWVRHDEHYHIDFAVTCRTNPA